MKQNNDGILYLFKKNKVAFFHGRGSFAGRGEGGTWKVAVGASKAETIVAKHVIVATGSNPRPLPGAPFDEKTILSNDGALAIGAVPKTLGVIGAGVIGLEMGSVWRRLGAEVTVLEALPAFLGAVDEQIAVEAHKAFTSQGLKIALGVKIEQGRERRGRRPRRVCRWPGQGAGARLRQAHRLDRPGAEHDRPERPRRSACSSTSAASSRSTTIAAPTSRTSGRSATSCAGRCSRTRPRRRASLSPSGSPGSRPHVDFNTVPWVIYTSPEIAWVGQTEQQLKAAGRDVRAGTFPFMANGRARALGDTTGS